MTSTPPRSARCRRDDRARARATQGPCSATRCSTLVRSGPSPAITRCASARRARATSASKSSASSGRFCCDEVTDESDQRDAVSDAELGAEARRAFVTIDGHERCRIAKVRDRPDRAVEAETSQLVAELGSDARPPRRCAARPSASGTRRTAATSRSGTRGCAATRGGRGAAATEHATSRGPAAVRDHDVGRRSRQQSPKLPTTPNHRDECRRTPSPRAVAAAVDAAVEGERERDQLILVPEHVELVCELDRHELPRRGDAIS